jgi:hypothetical protein
MTIPTPDDIEAAIEDILSGPRPYDGPLWEAFAYDHQGQWQAIGYGHTPAEACAVAWLHVCGWMDGDDRPDHLVFQDVPRHVPLGWYFELIGEPTN